ncbi:MAG TPA: hypothetical protein VNE82_03495 [Candidatus Binataceae bacterium]|nr:hypothetical protein [Candidatus Binataceae bacterium]
MSEIEKIAFAAIPVIVGVLLAGIIMNSLAGSFSLIQSAAAGYNGAGGAA